jgi:hypothetical protein
MSQHPTEKPVNTLKVILSSIVHFVGVFISVTYKKYTLKITDILSLEICRPASLAKFEFKCQTAKVLNTVACKPSTQNEENKFPVAIN